MGHVQTTIRKLMTWARVRPGTRSGIFHYMPDGYVHTRSLLIRIFAILMKFNKLLTAVKLEYTLTIIT